MERGGDFRPIRQFVEFWNTARNSHFDRIDKIDKNTTKNHYNHPAFYFIKRRLSNFYPYVLFCSHSCQREVNYVEHAPPSCYSQVTPNKTGTSKVGAIPKAKKSAVFKICVGRFHEKLLFSSLRLLFRKTPYSSDITSKIRI